VRWVRGGFSDSRVQPVREHADHCLHVAGGSGRGERGKQAHIDDVSATLLSPLDPMPPVAQSGFERQPIKWFGHLMRRFRQRDGF
jgi:hypothetical protein